MQDIFVSLSFGLELSGQEHAFFQLKQPGLDVVSS